MQYMEIETAGQAAVKFEMSVPEYTEVLLWDASLLQWHTVKVELKAEWFLIAVTASWWWEASREVLIFSSW